MARAEALTVRRGLGERKDSGRSDDPVVTDDHRAVVQRRAWGEQRFEHVWRQLRVHDHPGLGTVLQTRLALDHHEHAHSLCRQPCSCLGDVA
jgi:hypothetical protein